MSEKSQTSNFDRVMAMETAAFQGNWDLFKSYMSEDIYFKVGGAVEVTGPQSVAEYYQKTQSTQLKITGADTRGTWEFENVVVIEMDVQATRISDGKSVAYPSVDIFRFKDSKVHEWRTYPVFSLFTAE